MLSFVGRHLNLTCMLGHQISICYSWMPRDPTILLGVSPTGEGNYVGRAHNGRWVVARLEADHKSYDFFAGNGLIPAIF